MMEPQPSKYAVRPACLSPISLEYFKNVERRNTIQSEKYFNQKWKSALQNRFISLIDASNRRINFYVSQCSVLNSYKTNYANEKLISISQFE